MRISDWSSDVCSSDLEQPDDIDEMPIPGSRFETEMLLGGEVAIVKALQADREEDGADDDVKAMKPGRHEKGRAVNGALEGERRMIILRRLDRAVHQAKPDRSEEHTSELQSLMRKSYAVFCLKKKIKHINNSYNYYTQR